MPKHVPLPFRPQRQLPVAKCQPRLLHAGQPVAGDAVAVFRGTPPPANRVGVPRGTDFGLVLCDLDADTVLVSRPSGLPEAGVAGGDPKLDRAPPPPAPAPPPPPPPRPPN